MELERDPGLKFAVFDRARNAPLPGWSPESLPVFEDGAAVKSTHTKFTLHRDYPSFCNSPAGQLLAAVYGHRSFVLSLRASFIACLDLREGALARDPSAHAAHADD